MEQPSVRRLLNCRVYLAIWRVLQAPDVLVALPTLTEVSWPRGIIAWAIVRVHQRGPWTDHAADLRQFRLARWLPRHRMASQG